MIYSKNTTSIGVIDLWSKDTTIIADLDANKIVIEAVTDFTKISALPSHFILSRLSAATYWSNTGELKDVTIDQPRFDCEYIGGKWIAKGLLVEKSSTNTCYYSNNFTSNAQLTVNGGTSGGGATFANGIISVKNVSSATAYAYQGFTEDGSKITTQQIVLNLSSYSVGSAATDTFNIIAASLPISNYTQTPLGNSKSLFKFNSGVGTPYTQNKRWGINQTISQNAQVSVPIAFMQMEVSGYPTSLIKTSGAATTRLADVLSYKAKKPQSLKLAYQRQDNNLVESIWLDCTVGNNLINLAVGAWINLITVYNRILTNKEKESA